jgi:hypothetical protein
MAMLAAALLLVAIVVGVHTGGRSGHLQAPSLSPQGIPVVRQPKAP